MCEDKSGIMHGSNRLRRFVHLVMSVHGNKRIRR
jgi:hypothetical protein